MPSTSVMSADATADPVSDNFLTSQNVIDEIRHPDGSVQDIIPVWLPLKVDIALPGGTPPQSYGALLATWDHTVLPATRHKWTRPA